MAGGTVSEAMDEGAPVPGSARVGSPSDGDDPTPTSASPRRGRRWLRRLGLLLVLVLVAAAIASQVQVAEVRNQVHRSEDAQRTAEGAEQRARSRLASVDARLRTASEGEAEAQRTLDRSRAEVQAQGLEEARLGGVQVETARRVKELRAAVRSVQGQIEEQGRVRPAAAACLFDLLRALGQVDDAHTGPRSEACTAVAGSPGPG
jgi:type II secretory pathway component PulK